MIQVTSGPDDGLAALDRLPLHRHEIAAAGRVWQIDAVRDQSALLELSDGFAAFPFGLLLWESSLALADRIAAEAEEIRGAEVLEIGAGTGLAGLAAAAFGARVVQTDHSSEAIALSRRNAALNAIDGMTWAQSDWRDWRDERRYDLIIGADVLYERETHALVSSILALNLAPGGRAILADPCRLDTPAFVSDLRAQQWRVATRSTRIPSIAPVHLGQVIAIDLIEVRRP